jgi:hypothetical protein
VAGRLIEIGAATQTQPPAAILTKRAHREGQQYLLLNKREEADLVSFVKAQSQLVAAQLLILGRKRLGGQDKRKFLFYGESVALETPAAIPINSPSEEAVKKQLSAGAVIIKIHVNRRREAKIPNLALRINQV